MSRPSYNTGTGFYVGADKKLYDPSNQQFIPRGVNQAHYDSGSGTAIANTKANAARVSLYWDNFIAFSGTPTYISATQFSVIGNQTAFFYPNGRAHAAVTAGAIAGTISAAVFASGLTTVTVTWDSGSSLDSSLSAVSYGTRAADFATQLYNEHYLNGIVSIPGVWFTSSAYGHTDNTCSASATNLQNTVDQWVGQASIWTANYQGIPTERWMIINIANEWGPSNSTTWRDSYITAISRMRTAGYLHTLLIDSGGCGQNTDDIINYAQAVFDSDPQKNVVFALHWYRYDPANGVGGSTYVSGITNANPAVVTYTGPDDFSNGNQIIMAQISGMTQVNSVDGANIIFKVKNVNVGAKTFQLTDLNDVNIDSTGYGAFVAGPAGSGSVGGYTGQTHITSILQSLVNTGLPIIVGEFGPGRNIGASPTMAWPGDVIRAANSLSAGWLAWAIDDNNLGGGAANDFWFDLLFQNGVYNSSSDLTIYGKDVIENGVYGLKFAGYAKANFTYSPGLQETPEASNWQAHHRKLWGRHKKKKDEDQERRELGILPDEPIEPPQSVMPTPMIIPDRPREIIKPARQVKRPVVIPRATTPPRIPPTEEEYDNAYKMAYKAAYMEAISTELSIKDMKRRERLRAAGIIPMEKGYGRRRGS